MMTLDPVCRAFILDLGLEYRRTVQDFQNRQIGKDIQETNRAVHGLLTMAVSSGCEALSDQDLKNHSLQEQGQLARDILQRFYSSGTEYSQACIENGAAIIDTFLERVQFLGLLGLGKYYTTLDEETQQPISKADYFPYQPKVHHNGLVILREIMSD